MGKKDETLLTDTRPVVVKAAFKGERINDVDSLKVLVEGKDSGGAGVTFKFEWTKNGEPAGDGDTLSGLKRGDKISVKITPYNGKEYGQSKIVTTEIWNIPPKVIDFKKLAFDGKAYACQVKAMDPDGDPLTYSIKSGPPGMTINSATGLIQWDVPPDFVGKAPVSVSVTDGHGGEALYNFDAIIKIEGSK